MTVAGNPIGNLAQVTPTFTATEVYAGSSIESTIQDHVKGIVAGRTGDTLTLVGASLVDRIGDLGFTQSIPVTLAPTTIVSVDGVASPSPAPTINTISIGQYIEVSGQVNPANASNNYVNPDGSLNPTGLDATYGQVRIKPTTLWGILNSATPGSASVNLEWVEHYELTDFNFAGTGTSSSLDATASNYSINTGTTDLTPNVNPAAPPLFEFIGLANAFGQGPPYFNATTATPASSLPQQLIIEWSGNGSANPFTSVSGSGLSVNLQDPTLAGTVHVIRRGPPANDTDILTLTDLQTPNQLVIVPATAAPQSQYLFTVGNVLNNTSVFSDPAAFATSVTSYIALAPISKLVATGQYAGSGNFVATNIEIAVH